MNAFANSLFSVMLGWARSLFQKVLAIFSDSGDSSLLEWLGDHWLGLAIVLILVGLVIDFVVWMCRWKPYLAWRTAYRKLTGRMSGRVINDRSFDKGYSDALSDMAQPDLQEASAPAPYAFDDAADYGKPGYAEPQQQDAPYAPQPAYGQQPVYSQQPVYEQQPAAPAYAEPYAPYQQPYQPQPYRQDLYGQQQQGQPVYPYQNPAYYQPQPAAQKQQSALGKTVSSLRSRLRPDAGNEEIQGLPPIKQKEDAFYEPVYPDERKGYRG